MTTLADRNEQSEPTAETYSFTLVLTGFNDPTPEIENGLFEAGCDDATLAVRDGVPYLAFDREAGSLADAINSAIANVNHSGLGIEVVRAVLLGEETISVINAYLKVRQQVSESLPKELADKVDEILQAIGAHKPDVLRNLLTRS